MSERRIERFSGGSPRGSRRALIRGALVALLAVAAPLSALAQTLIVGGKDFTEQLLMAEMTAQLLTSKGFQVERRSGYDTTRLRQAQEAGIVDLYWEYTGTSLREFHKVTEQLPPRKPTPASSNWTLQRTSSGLSPHG